MTVSEKDRILMLQWARRVMEARLHGTNAEAPDLSAYPSCGVFVTLHKKGNLRGCIGHTVSRDPLEQTLREAALAAAFQDPRFPPVTAEELPGLDLEISLLSPPEEIGSPEELTLGEHGAILQSGFHSGLFLPQVAPEQGWGLEEFMDHLCMKAGLPPSLWREKGEKEYRLFRFTALVFSEKE
jgi:uncharacterized protein